MNIVVWGAGLRGKEIYKILPNNTIVAYIDSNEHYEGMKYNEIPIISFEEYKKTYSDYSILVSPLLYTEIENLLKENSIMDYWILTNEPTPMNAQYADNLEHLFYELYSDEENIIVKGNTLYALLTYNFLLSKGKNVKFMPSFENEDRWSSDRYVKLENCIYHNDKNMEAFNKLLVCDKSYNKCLELYGDRISCIDATNSFSKIAKHYHPKLNKFKNIYNFKRCFIIANGPSLTMKDLEKIHSSNEISFGVNNIYKSDTKWRPDYYVIADIHSANIDYKNIIDYEVETKFVMDRADGFWGKILPPNIYKYHLFSVVGNEGIHVSDDITHGMYAGMTVIHICLQLAMYMGFNEIYIIGADTTAYGATEKSHFVENYEIDEMKKVIKKFFLDTEKIINGYSCIKTYAEKNNIKIFNATRGGALEVFERVNFDELFKSEGEENV